MTTRADELASLAELDQILMRAHTAEALFALDEGKTLSAAVNKLADAGYGKRYSEPFRHPVLDELDAADYDDDLTEDEATDVLITKALIQMEAEKSDDGHLPSAIRKAVNAYRGGRAQPNLVLGKNRTRIGDTRSGDRNAAPRVYRGPKDFEYAAEQPVRKFKKLTQEGVEIIGDEEDFDINETATSILEQAAVRTKAQASIVARGEPTERSVRDMLPKSWTDPAADHTVALGAEINTRKALPAEWQTAKIEVSKDRSFSAMRKTAAARTLDRPVTTAQNVGKGNGDTNQQSYMTPSAYKGDDASDSMGAAETFKKHPDTQDFYTADLRHLSSPRPTDRHPTNK